MAGKVIWEKVGKVVVLTFGQITVDPEFIAEFCHVLDLIEADSDIRVAVIGGAKGKTFFSGYNIGLFMNSNDAAMFTGRILEVQQMMDRIEKCTLPVIAVVDGYALGGGCELVLACDLVYASERAMFGTPEVKIGLIPAAGGVIRLPQQLTKHQAMEMIMTGKMYSANQARDMGIVNAVFHNDEVWDEALKTANTIADNAPIAVQASKACVVASLNMWNRHLEHITAEQCTKCLLSQDIKEGVTAFVQKRAPSFKGK